MDKRMNKQMDKYISMSPSNSIPGGQKKILWNLYYGGKIISETKNNECALPPWF